MAPSTLHRATLLTAALSTILLQLALWKAHPRPWLQVGGLALVLAISVVAGRWFNAKQGSRIHPLMIVTLIVLWLMPLAAEPVLRAMFGLGNPWELVIVVSLRNAMWGLAAVRNHQVCQRMACAASFFLAMFAFTLHFSLFSSVLIGLYSIVAMWWLIGGYWERLSGKMPAATERHLPKRATVTAIGIVALFALVICVALGRGESRRVLAGFFPSSGGEGRGDPFATDGVGDGDQLIGAQFDASTFGPVESEVFLESDLPSLYDVFDESYGEPPKPKSERAIALAPQEQEDCERQTAMSTTSSREFSTVRQRRHAAHDQEDRRTAALLYLIGRSPTHLALEAFDTFDGVRWSKSNTPRFHSNLRLETVGGKPWLRVKSPTHELFTDSSEPYAVKIINLETDRFPSPPQLARVHIDKVDRLEFYGWSDEGILEMPNREHIPQLSVVHLRSLQPLSGQLEALGDFRTLLPAKEELRSNSTDTKAELDRLSRSERLCYDLAPYYQTQPEQHLAKDLSDEWTLGKPAGWQEVQAIVEGLRREFVHDPDAIAPADCQDIVAHFLQAGRGPDYMFATTAAMMLRQKGYPTRLVGGFYADPKRLDYATRETAVLGEDVHMWAEVCIDGVHWMPIEPTPGYEPPPEALTAVQWAIAAFWATLDWLSTHWLVVSICALLTATVVIARRPLLDGAAWLAWRALGQGSTMNRIRWTVWLLEWRAFLAGRERPGSITLSRWCSHVAGVLPESAARQVEEFARACDSVLYGHGGPRDDMTKLCRNAVRVCKRSAFGQSAT